MDNPAKLDPRLLETLEASRPGGEDLSDPELSDLADRMAADPKLREVYDKLKQTDVVLANAFHDVPVPEGLGDRILERLASAGEPSASVAKRGRFWRSRRVQGAALVGLAVTLMVVGLAWFAQEDPLTREGVVASAVELFNREGNGPQGGNLISKKRPPGGYQIDPLSVAQLAGIRWRTIDGFLGRSGVAYDLAPVGSPRATLYVIKQRVANLDNAPSPNPRSNSQSRFASAWLSNGLLYVLVVEGGLGRYQEVLGISSRPLA